LDPSFFYVKDLNTLEENYNLKDIVIIDNSILSFAYHLYNGVPIVPFIDQANDSELMFTAHYLVSIANYDDLSLENKKHLNLDNLLTMAKMLNEIDDNEDEEEEVEEKERTVINITEQTASGKTDDVTKNINNTTSQTQEIKTTVNDTKNINETKEDNNKNRQSMSKSRKTIKITTKIQK